MRLPPKGINPDADLPRTPMEEAKLSWAVSHKVITFILGPVSDPFYKAAHEYWRQPGRTDVLVTSQRTLTDLLNYLNDPKHAPPNGNSWGQINLVTHANEEGGMGIKLSAQSQNNISPEDLEQQINAGAIPKVDGGVVDRSTAINVHGCHWPQPANAQRSQPGHQRRPIRRLCSEGFAGIQIFRTRSIRKN